MENKKINEELNKFNLLFKYNPAVTLEENISSIKKDAINESETNNILSEGALTDFLRSSFGTAFKSTVGAASETLLTKALQDIIKGGKQFSINLLRNTTEFKEALKNTVAEACRVKYGKTFNELVAFDKNAAQKLVNEVQGGIEAEMNSQAKSGVKNINKDVTKSQKELNKAITNPKTTAADIKAYTKELKTNLKLQDKWLKAQKTIKGMTPAQLSKIKKLLDAEVKVKPVPPVGGATVSTKSGLFTMTKDQISKLPGKVKTLVVNNKVKSILAAAGLTTVAALWYFWPSTDDTSVALVDENGNPLTDTPTTGEWAPCIQNLINNKSGVVGTSPSGEVSVVVTKTGNEEYDKLGGLQFYSNGRVRLSGNGKMGSWTCKDGEAVIKEMFLNEQTDADVDADVETMIDLLDFPVTSGDMQDALSILKKYSTSPKGKEFLKSYKDAGYGRGSLQKSLSYITTTKASSARAKREMLGLISQIEGGKTTPTPTITPNPSTGGGIGGINITWDGEKTTEPVTPDVKSSEGTKKSSKFTDRDKFPYSFGHRGPIIKEVQICFGFPKKWQTGNFGPITLKKLQELYGTSEINEDTYKRIKEKCNPTSTTGSTTNTGSTITGSTITGSTITGSTKPIEDTKPVSDTTASTTQPPSSPKTESGGELYARLNAAGLLGPRKFQKNVIIYKGEDLSKEELDKITTYLSTRGFRLSRDNKDKRFGEKIVFKKNKPTEETGNAQDNTDISDLENRTTNK